MATQDNVIDIGVVTDASPVGRAGFGTCALADDCTMSERVRYFESATAIDAAQTAGDITAGQAAGLKAALSQSPRPQRVAAIRVDPAASGGIAGELSAVQAEQGDWFGLGFVSRDKAHILAAAAWVEANDKMFFAQTSDADAVAGTAGNVLETLESSSRHATRGHWYSDDDVPFAFALLARFLAADPDIESTQADYIQLSGIPADDANITPTQRAQLAAYNAAFYLTLGGVPASGGGNKMASGRFVDTQLAVGWMRARVSETLKQLLLDFAARKSKIPFTDVGFGYIEGAVFDVLYQGVRAGHFSDTDEAGPYVNMPKRAELGDADVAARNLPFTFGAPEAGGVLTIQGTGLISANLDLVASLAA